MFKIEYRLGDVFAIISMTFNKEEVDIENMIKWEEFKETTLATIEQSIEPTEKSTYKSGTIQQSENLDSSIIAPSIVEELDDEDEVSEAPKATI